MKREDQTWEEEEEGGAGDREYRYDMKVGGWILGGWTRIGGWWVVRWVGMCGKSSLVVGGERRRREASLVVDWGGVLVIEVIQASHVTLSKERRAV